MLAVSLSAHAGTAATVVLTPNTGAPGEVIQVDGSLWITDDTKTIDLVEAGMTVGSALPVLGVFSTTFTVPAVPSGSYTVNVWDATESVLSTFTVVDVPLVIAIASDADGDGAADSTVSPYTVWESASPSPSLTLSVTGGGGGEYALEFTNLPALGALVDPTTASELFEGSTLSTTGGSVVVEFVGAPQASASFSDSDSFIVRASDATGSGAPMIVGLQIVDINQPVVIDREPTAVVAAGTTTTIPLVNFEDIDADAVPDPSVYDTDGDAVWFTASSGVSALGAPVSVTNATLTYSGLDHTSISVGDPVVDTVAVEVWDGGGASSTLMTVTVDVHPVAELGLHVDSGTGFAQSVRVGFGPSEDVLVDGSFVSVSDLTRQLSPPDAPSAGFALGIVDVQGTAEKTLRDIRATVVPSVTHAWEVSVRTGSAGGSGSTLSWDVAAAALMLSEVTTLTGEEHSAVIANTATGEAWDITSVDNGAILLDDNQAYTFALTVAPSEAAHTFDMSLEAGWNLVSVPGEGDFADLDALSNSAFIWDGDYAGLAVLDGDVLPAVSAGVFVNSFGGLASLQLDLDSSGVRSVAVELAEGWNLIGGPSDVDAGGAFPTSAITEHFANDNGVFGYSPSTGYFTVTELRPGAGYWVYNDSGAPVTVDLTQTRHLAIDGSSLFHPTPAASISWSVPLTMELGDGATRRVEIATSSGASRDYDRLDIPMPPRPPIANYSELFVAGDGAVTRLMRNAQTAERSGTEWVVSARVEEDTAVLRWGPPGLPLGWRLTLDGGGAAVDMRERRSVRLGRGTREYRVALSWVAPERTRLLPNYPNPFNPETWIPFELTAAADVAVRIYGGDGAVVRSFDLGHRAAGYYTGRGEAAYWDGRNSSGEAVASGVYVYELRAGDYHAIRRMLVLK